MKTDYTIQAPVDLAGLTRYQLAVYVSNLERSALHVVLQELRMMERDNDHEGKGGVGQ